MEEIPLIQDVVVIFGLALAVMLVCLRLRIPGLVGLLVTGLIGGPQGLGLVHDLASVDTLAQVGIALLLFGVGVEISLARFIQMLRQVLVGGGLQVALTLIAGIAIGTALGRPLGESILLGCLLSLSSTVIDLKLLQEYSELNTPHGQIGLSILIFQDLIVVPMMLVVPLLGGTTIQWTAESWIVLGEGLLILTAVLVAAKMVVPRLLSMVASTRNEQLFLLTILLICGSVAYVTASQGLSLALGAFLAGLIISESEYHHHVVGHLFPFREVFTSFFFVSTGMLLDVSFLADYWWLVILSVLGVCFLKTSIIAFVVVLLGYPLYTAILTGLALCQIGEFSFVLIRAGMDNQVASDWHHKFFLSTALLSMAVTPLAMYFARSVAKTVGKLPWPRRLREGLYTIRPEQDDELSSHVIIAGFGTAGRNLAYSLKSAGVPYVIIENDPDKVARYRKSGEPINFGDATHQNVLRHAGVERATALAILTHNEVSTHRTLTEARSLNAALYIVVQTADIKEIAPLTNLGANDVVPAEFEASVEVLTLMLRKYLVPRDEINWLAAELRADRYKVFRHVATHRPTLSDLKIHLSNMEIDTFRLMPSAELVGKSLSESGLRSTYHITVLLIQRNDELLWALEPTTTLEENDIVVLFGSPAQLAEAAPLFAEPK